MPIIEPNNISGLLSASDRLAIKEVKRAQALILLALDDWAGDYTFYNVHDAAELLKTAAWRIRNDDAA